MSVNHEEFPNVIYARYGVLTTKGQTPVAISGVYATDDKKKLVFEGNTDSEKVWSVNKLNIFPLSGTIYFRSRGTEYVVREVRDNDGLWLSKYGVSLPEDALGALIQIGGQMGSGEQFTAVSTDDSPYVVGLLYKNGSGTYARQDGLWVKLAENDTTYDSMVPIGIEPSKANAFLKLYDKNYVSVSDAENYESSSDKPGGAPEDRPAEED